MINRFLKKLRYILVFAIALFWGMMIVKWQIPPYRAYVWVKEVLGIPAYMGPVDEVTKRMAFVGPLIEPENQINPPVQTIDQIDEQVRKLELDVSQFHNAFDMLHVSNTAFIKANIFSLDFEIGREYSTYCYFNKNRSNSNRTAILLIPGSGYNQSSAILPGGVRNYHDGLHDVAMKYGDVYVYIKPNEDIRAIHNGRHKLDYNFITNSLISHGASYSAYYVVETLAITKYLKQKYDKVIIVGVSQGATAAGLNGLQSWPNAVLCLSGGYFPSNSYVTHSSPYNILIPGLNNIIKPKLIPSMIKTHSTQWLFTNGKTDIGVNRVLAEENFLLECFQQIEQVTVKSHSGGHEVPVEIIDNYLRRILLN